MVSWLLCLAALGCSGTSPDTSADAAPPTISAPSPAPPPLPTPPPAPAPSPPARASNGPSLSLERDAAGKVFVRLTEGRFDPFAGKEPDRRLDDRKAGPDPGKSFILSGPQTVAIDGLAVKGLKYGLQLLETPTIWVKNYTYTRVDGGDEIYGGAVKLGNNNRPTTGITYLQEVTADGEQQPDGSYKDRNTDFIGVEANNAPLYLRNITGRNFGDAGVDAKAKVYIQNATLENAHRIMRAWGGGEIILVNSIVNAAPGHASYGCRTPEPPCIITMCSGAKAPRPHRTPIPSAAGNPGSSKATPSPRMPPPNRWWKWRPTLCPRSAPSSPRRSIRWR